MSGYKRARELLADKCGNPHRASQQIQRELRDGKVVRSLKDLDALSICLRKGIDCLTHIGMLSELNSQNTIKAVISRVQFRNVFWMNVTLIPTLTTCADFSTRR